MESKEELKGKMHDSGKRQEFDTGAVRDTTEGKGRFDLIPFNAWERLAGWLRDDEVNTKNYSKDEYINGIFDSLINYGNGYTECDYLSKAAYFTTQLINLEYKDEFYNNKYVGFPLIFGHYNEISPTALMELAKWSELGSLKYNDRNWELGMPISRCLDSGLRHLSKYVDEWKDEAHIVACLWNIFAIMFFEKYKPELQDLPNRMKKDGIQELVERN